jgi:thioesterase CepJ
MRVALSTGITVSYNVDGQGPPLLMLGGPHSCELMRSIVGPLLTGAGYQLITMEYRGLPPSDVPEPPYTVEQMATDTANFIERVGVAPCLAFGYSMGAFIVQELAVRRPDLVSRIALAGTRTKPTVVYRHMHQEALDRLEAGTTIPYQSLTLLRALLMFAPRRLSSDPFVESVLTILHQPPVPGYSEIGLTYASAHYEVDLNNLSCVTVPSLVIGFQDDVLTPPSQGRAVAEAIPDCRYREIKYVAHGAFMEKPRELTRLVVEFFRRQVANE